MSDACATPIGERTFEAWWAGELASDDRRRCEEHLLGCAECSHRLTEAASVADGIRSLVRSGRVGTVVSPGLVERLHREGRRVREYRVPAGGGVECTVAPDDDVLLSRLALPAASGSRVDLVMRLGDGEERRVPDVPLEPGAAELLLASPIDVVRSWPASVLVVRLVAVGASGERPLADYTFRHSPWPDTR